MKYNAVNTTSPCNIAELLTVPPGFTEGMAFIASSSPQAKVSHVEPEALTLTVSQLLFKDGILMEDSDVTAEQTDKVLIITVNSKIRLNYVLCTCIPREHCLV